MSPNFEKFKPLISLVEKEIVHDLQHDDQLISQLIGYIIGSGGKRLRPLLFILAGQVVSKGSADLLKELIRLSPTFEIVHTASLLHDDLVDEADSRRGRPAAHKVFGAAQAVLVGDYLLARAALLALTCQRTGFMEQVAQTLKALSEGELLQLQSRFQGNLSAKTYFEIIYGKTAALIEACTYLGALTAHADPKTCLKLGRFGRKIGLAFQIIDDCLDYSGLESHLGKPIGNDLIEGQVTLPFILARESVEEKERRQLIALGSKAVKTPDDLAEILALVTQAQGVAQAQKTAEDLLAEAVSELQVFSHDDFKEDLIELAIASVKRSK